MTIKFGLKNRQDLAAEGTIGREAQLSDGTVFRCLRAGGANGKFTTTAHVKLKALERQYGKRPVPADVLRAMWAGIYAEAVVIGWEGVCDDKGEPVPFTSDACRELLSNLEFDHYYRAIDDFAGTPENFQVVDAEGPTPEKAADEAGN